VTEPSPAAAPHPSVFERIVVGVSDLPEDSVDAVRQAARLLALGGRLHLFCAVYIAGAAAAGWEAAKVAEELEREAGEAMRHAREIAPDASWRLVNGPAVRCLLNEIEREQATLVCIGHRGGSRVEGIIVGGVTATMLHEAPCSVLVARPAPSGHEFPRSIVVGVDGSPQSGRALAAAQELRERFGAELETVAALGGKRLDLDAARALAPELETDRQAPVEALAAAARGADLLVVGSRGLHGIRALGSVSERVAHRAPCSVLVVREPHPA